MIASDEETVHQILLEVNALLPKITGDITPPEIGREVYRIVSRLTGVKDPYREIKEKCTQQALALYPGLKERVQSADDRLRKAIRIAIAGNVIDFGSNMPFDMEKDLESILNQRFAIDHYNAFTAALSRAKDVLYIADNAGETVFDRVLIEELGKPVTYVVREHPIINDAVREDAIAAGIDKVADIISSGADAPGNILHLCSDEFFKVYESSDFIISKGQGNYEGLSGENRPIFFLLKAKCHVIAKHIGVEQGSIILKSIQAK
ncbi:MAG: ARMT1-like domain-containing protein [Candidatus Aminicenantaceae bacterium]